MNISQSVWYHISGIFLRKQKFYFIQEKLLWSGALTTLRHLHLISYPELAADLGQHYVVLSPAILRDTMRPLQQTWHTNVLQESQYCQGSAF